jgi:hypothetical protein
MVQKKKKAGTCTHLCPKHHLVRFFFSEGVSNLMPRLFSHVIIIGIPELIEIHRHLSFAH